MKGARYRNLGERESDAVSPKGSKCSVSLWLVFSPSADLFRIHAAPSRGDGAALWCFALIAPPIAPTRPLDVSNELDVSFISGWRLQSFNFHPTIIPDWLG